MKIRVACMGALFAAACLAQEVTGTIVGSVTDKSGAAVSGARVTVTATDQNRVIRSVTSIGNYSVSADAKGFKRLVKSGDRITRR